MLKVYPVWILIFSILTINYSCEREEFRYLFNGKDLSGWKRLNGNAEFIAKDGMIIGTTVSGEPNSFLATEEEFGNFILELEVKADSTNSGVQFRSKSSPDYREGKVYGYQMEIDPGSRKWSGGIYEEGGRGWLFPLDSKPEVQDVYKQGEWNTYRIECKDDHIRTYINEILIAELRDTVSSKGFVALQIISIPVTEFPGKSVRWRNIRIKELKNQ